VFTCPLQTILTKKKGGDFLIVVLPITQCGKNNFVEFSVCPFFFFFFFCLEDERVFSVEFENTHSERGRKIK